MSPINALRESYTLLGATIDNSIIRLNRRVDDRNQELLVLQGVYLFGVRAFEAFLENQMIHLCHPKERWGPKIVNGVNKRSVAKVRHANKERVKTIILMGADYANYLPYDQTLRKADALFVRGRPFSLLSPDDIAVIRRACAVRNLIAHESAHSQRQFERQVMSRYRLLPGNQNIEGYLLHEAARGVPMAKADLAGLFGIASFLS